MNNNSLMSEQESSDSDVLLLQVRANQRNTVTKLSLTSLFETDREK